MTETPPLPAPDGPATALTRLGQAVRVSAFLLAIVSIGATFLLVTGLLDITLTEKRALALVVVTAFVAVSLLGVVLVDLLRLFRQRSRGQAGARLHLRIVGLFTLIAAVPAVLIAVVATVTLERGLNPWFSGALRELVTSSGTIAQGYQQQLCQNVGREMRVMAEDMEQVRRAGVYEQDRALFRRFMTARAINLGFPFAVLMNEDGTIRDRAETRATDDPLPPRDQDYKDAASAEPPCLLTAKHVGAVLKLPNFDNIYLYVARPVDQRAVAFGTVAAQAVEQYRLLDAQRANVQRAFAIMYAIIALMLILSAMWIGLAFAERLVAPIRRLITASDAVTAGNLYVQVPTQKSEGDIGRLGQTFNGMIAEIRQQQNRLMATTADVDRRRRFTEAVLSGVSVGVIGVDRDGVVAIANPGAERILGNALHGRSLALITPEVDALFQEAKATRSGSLQRQITLVRETREMQSREMELFVRVTSEQAGSEGRGFVITLDDISDLVTAQRTSAWADVARRIAHEIKNPLTPIQLSAERIRRKYGRVIVEDREIFEQCTNTIIRQVDDIRRMVDEFSSFARMPKPQPERDDIVDVLRQSLFMMRVSHPAISFTDNLPPGPMSARFDRRLIGQAVQNILKNATEGIAARPAGAVNGTINLSLTQTGDGMLLIEVADNGIGFPKETRHRLLEPYMTTRDGGTGLGLPIVAKILEEHGGGIQLLDAPGGQGALVRMSLAATGAAQSTEQPDMPDDKTMQHTKKVST